MSGAALDPLLENPDPEQEAKDATKSDVYINPLDQSSRFGLQARAHAYRYGAAVAFGMGNMSSPAPPAPTQTAYFDSTLSKKHPGKDKIKADVYMPPNSKPSSRKTTPGASSTSVESTKGPRRPAVINFHGGGFVLGQGTDDARWIAATMDALGAVVFSVNYRLAPSYPFPTPVEDCADAVLQIFRRADEFWIDPERIILTGFSAGSTLALASWVLLQDHAEWNYSLLTRMSSKDSSKSLKEEKKMKKKGIEVIPPSEPTSSPPMPAGIMLFYPLLDWTISRPRKRLSCSKPEMTLPRSLTDVFDASYIYPPEEVKQNLDDPRLSPGLMSDELVDRLPPVQLCLCEWDMLLAEGQRFAERLKSKDKDIGVRVVKEAKHAWDKPPPFSPPGSMEVEYGEAIRVMGKWLGRDVETKIPSMAKEETADAS